MKVSELNAARLVVMNNSASAGEDSNVPWEWKLPDDFNHVAVLQIGFRIQVHTLIFYTQCTENAAVAKRSLYMTVHSCTYVV